MILLPHHRFQVQSLLCVISFSFLILSIFDAIQFIYHQFHISDIQLIPNILIYNFTSHSFFRTFFRFPDYSDHFPCKPFLSYQDCIIAASTPFHRSLYIGYDNQVYPVDSFQQNPSAFFQLAGSLSFYIFCRVFI